MNKVTEEIPEVLQLTERFFPVTFMMHLVTCSNNYCKKQKILKPDSYIWNEDTTCRPFILSCMYHSLAMLYYMGIMRLPAKRDYWTTGLWMSVHTVAKANNLSRDCFKFLWKHFHVSVELTEENVTEEDGDNSLVETIAEVGYLIDHIR
eukprot:CAMPEP_0194432024 /NCGR_PEP_ID=MMETSP0176-20130528/67807_1 /TAXON_ID=216777 /ORGANISM="Proboscia alata, Strain PI-D3" /LENGTH=148 /DNA_ID=CAMNT_0039247941 /DNA_START=32 /DNA_END=475 /DNA_ORIENTATION=+